MTQNRALLATTGLWTCLLLATDAKVPVQIVHPKGNLRDGARELSGIPLEGFGGTPDAEYLPLQECQVRSLDS